MDPIIGNVIAVSGLLVLLFFSGRGAIRRIKSELSGKGSCGCCPGCGSCGKSGAECYSCMAQMEKLKKLRDEKRCTDSHSE